MRCRWLLVAAAALAGASGLPAGADAAEAAAQQVPQAYSAPVPGAAVEAPGSGAAPAGAAVVDDLARFLEVTAQNSAALHSQEGHKARHKHRARHHLSEAELERRAAHYAKWAAKVWAPRTYYEHYYSHPAMGGQYYPQQGQQQQQQGHPEQQQQQQFHDGPPRFAERRADEPQHPASLLDHIAGIRSAAETRASAPMAYSGPMDQQQQGQQGQQGQQQAPSLLEAGAGAGAGAGSGSPAYGMSQDSALTSGGAYGPPMSEGPTDSLFAQQAPQQQAQAQQQQQQQVPLQQQQQQQQMMQMRLREQMMQQPAPPQQQQQMLPQQQLQYQQQAMQQPLFAPPQQPGQFAFRQQFQQQEAQGSMPSTQGQAMQFYAPTAFPPPAPNQVPFSNAQVNAAYPAQQQAPTTANMRFQAVGSTVQPPFDTNQQPMNPNAPRYQNEQANQYPFGGSLLEVDESAPVDLGEEEAPAGTIHPDVYLAARHPYRNSVRSPLTAQHMERFPELDEFTLPGSL